MLVLHTIIFHTLGEGSSSLLLAALFHVLLSQKIAPVEKNSTDRCALTLLSITIVIITALITTLALTTFHVNARDGANQPEQQAWEGL